MIESDERSTGIAQKSLVSMLTSTVMLETNKMYQKCRSIGTLKTIRTGKYSPLHLSVWKEALVRL